MPKVSQAHLDARRRQILDAASRCFARKGIGDTTIQDICQEAGLSPGAVYRYFSSRQEILYATFDLWVENNRDLGARLGPVDDPDAVLDQVFALLRGFLSDPELGDEHRVSLMVFAEGAKDPSVAARYVAVHQASLPAGVALFRTFQERGWIGPDVDVEALAWVFLALYQGLRTERVLDPSLDLDRSLSTARSLFGALLRR